MTKAELIDRVAVRADVTKRAAKEVIDAFCDTVQEADKVTLVGFGTFEHKVRAARTGRNPSTGAAIQIAESRNLHFKASKKK